MHRIGFNLLPWSATVSEALYPHIERIRDIGYDGIEYSMGAQDAAAYRGLGAFLADLDMACTSCLALEPEHNPASSDAAVRQQGLEKICWAIDRAVDTGAGVICGPFHSAFAWFTKAAPTPDEAKWSAEVLRQAGEYAEQAGVMLALEALNRFECYLCNTMQQLVELTEMVDHPFVQVMFDTHHSNIEEKSFAGAIRTAAPHLAHVHISENDRGTPGDGIVAWKEVFETLAEVGYEGWFTIESFTRADPDFANAINVWRSFSEPWDIAEQGYAFIKRQLRETAVG